MTTLALRGDCESFLLRQEVNLSPLIRLDAIFDRRYDILAMTDDLAYAEHHCEPEDDCCDHDYTGFGPDDHAVLAGIGWVYAHMTWTGDIVYIGSTTRRLAQRQKDHENDTTSPRFRRAMRLRQFGDLCIGWNVGDSCRRLERAAILVMQPVLNTSDVS